MKALLDTNILIDYLNGIEDARKEIGLYDESFISVITWMEVMIGADADEEAHVRNFLARFRQVGIDDNIAETAVAIRRNHRLRLPDAIIWASAQNMDALLITRNTRDFPEDSPGVRVPYRI